MLALFLTMTTIHGGNVSPSLRIGSLYKSLVLNCACCASFVFDDKTTVRSGRELPSWRIGSPCTSVVLNCTCYACFIFDDDDDTWW